MSDKSQDAEFTALVAEMAKPDHGDDPPPFCGHAGDADALDVRIWASVANGGEDEAAFLDEVLNCAYCRGRLHNALRSAAQVSEGWELEHIGEACSQLSKWLEPTVETPLSWPEVVVRVARAAVSVVSASNCGSYGPVPALAIRGDDETKPPSGAYFTKDLASTTLRCEIRPVEAHCDIALEFSPPGRETRRIALFSDTMELLELVDPVRDRAILQGVLPGRYWLEVGGAAGETQRVRLEIQGDSTTGAGPAEGDTK